MRVFFYILSFFLLLLSACYEDYREEEITEEPQEPVIYVDAPLSARLLNLAGDPVPGATVEIAGEQALSNEDGLLALDLQAIDARGEETRIFLPDGRNWAGMLPLYFSATHYQSLVVAENQTEISLSANEEAQVALQGGGEVDIPDEAWQTPAGQPHTGSCQLQGYALDMESPLHWLHLPGRSRAEEEQVLEVFSALRLEAFSGGGEALTLQSGERMQAVFPLLSDRLSDLPAQTGLWWYAPSQRKWVRKGVAVKKGVTYTAELDASGFWCVAEAYPATEVYGTLAYQGEAAANLSVVVVSARGYHIDHAFSAESGRWQGITGEGEEIRLQVRAFFDQLLFEQTLVPPFGKIDLGSLALEEQSASFFRLQGTLRACDDQGLNNGLLLLGQAGKQTWVRNEEARFDHLLPRESGAVAFSLKGYDPATGESGGTVSWPISPAVEVQSVFACAATAQEYIALRNYDRHRVFLQPQSFNQADTLFGLQAMGEELKIWVQAAGAGAVEDEQLNILIDDPGFGPQGYALYCPTSSLGCGFEEFIITHWADKPGEPIRGYFRGSFWMQTITDPVAAYRPLEGDFQVIRDF